MKIFFVLYLAFSPFLYFSQDRNVTYEDKTPEEQYEIAKIFFYENEYDSASLSLFKIISDTDFNNVINVKSHNLLGYIFSNTEKYDLAEEYLKIALNNSTDTLIKSQIYGNLGGLYYRQESFELALSFFEKSLAITPKSNNLDYQILLSNIGAAYIELKEPEKAMPYIKQANSIADSLGDKIGQSICINNFATIYRDLNQQDSALFYYQKALSLVDEFSSKEEKKKILGNLSELYELKGNEKLALDYYKQYTSLKDELFDSEKHDFIVETQEKYEAEKRLKDLAEMELKVQQKEAKERQFTFWFTLILIAVLVIFGSILAWLRWKSIQQKNKAKLALITATMHGEEKQRRKISQEIHDDLGGLLGVCRMLFSKSKNIFSNEQDKDLFKRIDSLLVRANSKSRAISHELFSPILKQFGLRAAIEEHIDNIQVLQPDLEINFSMDDISLEEQLELNCFRITQELFTNTIKYANASSIVLKIEKTSENLSYTYKDNGVGFDFSSITKGVGLNSIDARVKSFDGKTQYTTTDHGFEFKFHIPLKKS